jgi:hypothetical protein
MIPSPPPAVSRGEAGAIARDAGLGARALS